MAAQNRQQRGEGKPRTFTLLGFTHYCGKRKKTGRFIVWRKRAKKRMVAKLHAVKAVPRRWMHAPGVITVSVDDRMNTSEVRTALAADWPFLMDPERRLLHELEMTDTTDRAHGEVYIPYTFILDRDRTIYKIYNGWWFIGRPTSEEIRMDLRTLMSKRPDWIYSDKQKV